MLKLIRLWMEERRRNKPAAMYEAMAKQAERLDSRIDDLALAHGKLAASLIDHRAWIEALIMVNAENPRRAKALAEARRARIAAITGQHNGAAGMPDTAPGPLEPAEGEADA